jgi:hypothetical protein
MKLSDIRLEEVLVKAKQKDVAYEIIQKVIENKKKFLQELQSFKSNVYIKATELLTEKERSKKKIERVADPDQNSLSQDPFDNEVSESDDPRSKINMCEILSELNYQAPGRFKEIREGFKTYGDNSGLFIPSFSQTQFNFYRNMVSLSGISDVPVISPFSNTAILTYKYKLEASELEEGILVHKIKVLPRKSGNASCSGYVYINEGTWNINRLDLSLPRAALKLFDSFRLRLDYQLVQDTLWIVDRQEFTYESKQSNRKSFSATTLIVYSEMKPNYPFPDKFFSNEVSITTREAMERDSIYWTGQRAEPFTWEQQSVASYRDSIHRVHKSKAYLDSITLPNRAGVAHPHRGSSNPPGVEKRPAPPPHSAPD